MEEEPCIEGGQKKVVVTKTRRIRIRMEGPDGGWAWVVAFSACIISFIMAGLGRMSGILYVAFIETFGVDRKAASTPFSVRSSTRNLLGPIVGILGQKYGVRMVTITGGILATFSAAVCFFSPDIIWITILWGVLNGIGTALTVTLPQVVIGQYFEKHATTASGLAFSGGCVGSFLFPVLLEQLLLSYGMQGTFLIVGAIIMHTIPAAMILRKPPWVKKANSEAENCMNNRKKSLKYQSKDKEENEKLYCNGVSGQETNSTKKEPDNFPDIQFLKQNKELLFEIFTAQIPGNNVYLEINRNEPAPSVDTYINELEDIYSCLQSSREKWRFYQNLKLSKIKLYCDMLDDKGDGKTTSKSQSFQLGKCLEFDTSDITKTNSVPDISRQMKEINQNSTLLKLKSLQNAQSDILSTLPQEKQADASKIFLELQKLYTAYTALNSSKKDISFKNQTSVLDEPSFPVDIVPGKDVEFHPNTFKGHINTAMKLYKKPLFLLICLCRAVHFITFIPVITAVVDFIMDKGLVEADGKYAIAALSLGDLLGRLCLGWITDRGYMSLAKYMLVVMVLQGISTASLAWMNTKTLLFTMLAVFGMLQGSLFVRHNVLVSKYMKSHEQSIAMGCMNFFSGLLGFALPAYIGYFRDTIGSYDYIMYINGAIGVFIGLLWALEPYFRKRSAERAKNENSPVAV
ncbi:monocarboxylate transporter 9 [Trichonephila inaurata madagascariensis]|uniref:Monocarboxylate transporter 9 n=1 Tax=Trichonephila inaurata madagascariensis TaxID=2747483 RepID=A0A8X6YMN5_9ARAC|nr:monocarboxylate transporter 9 [Trichonephila inaurata madagascariensis]